MELENKLGVERGKDDPAQARQKPYLTPADRHGSVQVVSSTNGELGTSDDPGTGSSKPRKYNPRGLGTEEDPEVEVVSETK